MVSTGVIYYYVAHGGITLKTVREIAVIHTLGAFALIAFTIIHVYRRHGHTRPRHKAIKTGWTNGGKR